MEVARAGPVGAAAAQVERAEAVAVAAVVQVQAQVQMAAPMAVAKEMARMTGMTNLGACGIV
jgi:hypothetical protein